MIHFFKQNIEGISLPEKFTFPFHYTPHPLTRIAADEVRSYLSTRLDWQDEIGKGKMFGVLIVRTSDGGIGYLAAFSGNLAGSNMHDFFVPPVYDLLNPDGYFRKEESEISALNRRISDIFKSDSYLMAKKEQEEIKIQASSSLASAKEKLKRSKKERDEKRANGNLSPEELDALVRESQFQKAEYKRLENSWKERLNEVEQKVKGFDTEILQLKRERKTRSAALQLWLFRQFDMLNAKGERKDLCEIFKDTPQGLPPAGAGECALPKLLQYAYLYGLQPLAMGEFWCGMSPKDEIRHDGYFYPSCKGKCEPILKHMLVGFDVEPNPLAEDLFKDTPLKILYEDEWIVAVEKPSGMLSVPGKNDLDSVQQRLRLMYPDATGPLVVHRLDMATSGILLAAKDKDVHARLQSQFETRSISKEYIAILDGVPSQEFGIIDLPICLNPLDRPRQMVDFENGKLAITEYKVECIKDGRAKVVFKPHTGRTHQLRVHSAHVSGLGCHISGDELYGNPDSASRLCLHASRLVFRHPVLDKEIEIVSPSPFTL
ncbi:Ribosomal large subunit pseudouridine synthase A [uncultured Bacteroides sp.]|uniref:RluA family pseudouridine synthase n=1 Tax=Bacteroides cellulolyticus TaxID=2981780 RepID=UPI000820B7E7|nr:RluA family pseudouridine synthase [Bacteroides cellulolyticus]MCU6770508.1 pseudouridine synthase [Bacteroides cellulolyticus]SCH15037.1 Ribosomal large subunit pseudouridine synthase A [uncultured Bacteroides sp.]